MGVVCFALLRRVQRILMIVICPLLHRTCVVRQSVLFRILRLLQKLAGNSVSTIGLQHRSPFCRPQAGGDAPGVTWHVHRHECYGFLVQLNIYFPRNRISTLFARHLFPFPNTHVSAQRKSSVHGSIRPCVASCSNRIFPCKSRTYSSNISHPSMACAATCS